MVMPTSDSPILILGAGSWGTALAVHLSGNGVATHLWGWDPEQIKLMEKTRCNSQYLPDIIFPESLKLFSDLENAFEGVNDILIVVPSDAFRSVVESILPYLSKNSRVAWASKGLEPGTGKLLHEVAEDVLGKEIPLAMLAGPSFSKEVASGIPTAVTIASSSEQYAHEFGELISSSTFRTYFSYDIIGVQLGGAVKNVLAIAAGISDGLGYGANTRAALITRGLAEMVRLGVAMGAKESTFMGLAGVGDLILTCTDNQSRNRRFGVAVGEGKNPAEAEKNIGQVVEGIRNAEDVFRLAKKLKINMPITEGIVHILHDELNPQTVVDELLSRELKEE